MMVKVKPESVDVTESAKCPTLPKKRTKEVISVLKKLNQNFTENKSKKSLLDDSSESSVYLQVTLKKIPPKKLKRIIKVHLPHSLMTDTTEVCLITGDLEKNNKKAEIEPTVLHYKEILKKHGVRGIAEVVPLRQLRTEYKTFESKRQLSAAYDIFINDKKISGCLPKVLGKAFYEARKFPIQINLNTSNLKDQVERAVSETTFSLSCRGNSCTSEVARLSMEDSDILENIQSCVEILAEKLPGKWNNVLGLYIKTARSEALPIYMSFDNPNELKIKAPRHQEKVKAEELSTTLKNAQVKVFKDGRLVVKHLSGSEDESDEDSTKENIDDKIEESVKNISDSEEESSDEDSIKEKKSKKMKRLVKDEEESIEKVSIKENKSKKMKGIVKNEESIEEDPIKEKKSKKQKGIVKKEEEGTERDTAKEKKSSKAKRLVKIEDGSIEEDPIKESKTKKTKVTVMKTEGEEDANEGEVKSAIKRRKRVRTETSNENEDQVQYPNEVDIKPTNKRKKSKQSMSNDITKEESSPSVDVSPKIKRKKTKNLGEADVKVVEVKKRQTNKRNNK